MTRRDVLSSLAIYAIFYHREKYPEQGILVPGLQEEQLGNGNRGRDAPSSPRKEDDPAVKKNVGDTDAYLRIAGGLTMLGVGVMDRSRLMVAFGAMKVAEGITRYCPLLDMLNLNTTGQEQDLEPEMVQPGTLVSE